MKNGYYITQAAISPLDMKCDAFDPLAENDQFLQAYQPVIDEKNLIPKEITAIRRIFGHQNSLDHYSKDSFLQSHVKNYSHLKSAFYNFDD